MGHFWPQLWRAFPNSSQSRLLTCSCCCSSPSKAAPDQSQQTQSVTQVCSPEAAPNSQYILKLVRPGRPGSQTGKQWVSRKGKPPRKMAVCFQLASRQGREGHVHQSIEDHRPIRVRVSAASSNQEPSFRARLRLSRTGPWVAGSSFIYQNKVVDWPRSRRRAG